YCKLFNWRQLRIFFPAEDGIRDRNVTGVQRCALPILLGVPHRCGDGTLRNSAALLQGGRVAEWVHKQVLPNYAVFDEKRYFEAGDDTRVFEVTGVNVAVLAWEDIWDDAPAARAAGAGAGWPLALTASRR